MTETNTNSNIEQNAEQAQQSAENVDENLIQQQPLADEPVNEQETLDSDEQYQQLHDQHIRLQADFQNFRKRAESEKQIYIQFGVEKVVQELLPVMDNLERGTASLTENSDPKMLYQSFKLMYDGLIGGLANAGLKPIECIGQPFDPAFHEAVGQVDSQDYPEDTVAVELQKGFTLGDKVVRPAMVQVSTGSATSTAPDSASSEAEAGAGNPFKQV